MDADQYLLYGPRAQSASNVGFSITMVRLRSIHATGCQPLRVGGVVQRPDLMVGT
jgi:hypothetical protein